MVLVQAEVDDSAAYVQRELAPALNGALVELARARPEDPVAFLAEALRRHKPLPPVTAAVTAASDVVTLLHFNDVYNCEAPKKKKLGGAAHFVSAIKQAAASTPHASAAFFCGDAFNPSIMSTVVKGGQLPLVLNAAGV